MARTRAQAGVRREPRKSTLRGSAASAGTLPDLVPVRMQGPAVATQAGCPHPLVIAARTTPTGRERVPGGVATGEEWFRGIVRIATPSALTCGLPSAQRATDTLELVHFVEPESGDDPLIEDRGSLQHPLSRLCRGAFGVHCFVTVSVPDATSVFPALARSDHVPVAFFSSKVVARTTSAASSGGKSYLALMFLPSNDSDLQFAL
jgi:hypothetical protein